MTKILTFALILFCIPAFSQLDINEAYGRQKEFMYFKDSSSHTNIKPAFDQDTNICKNHLSFRPLFYESFFYDAQNKDIDNFLYIGGQLNARFKNFSFTTAGYYGLYKPADFYAYLPDSLGIVPGFGKILKKKSQFGGFIGHFRYRAADYIAFEVGNDKIFFGDGYRSLILSDNASPYPYFKTDVKVWKVRYVWLVAHQQGFDSRYSQNISDFYTKWTFTHYLSFNLFKRLNFSMFETVVTSPFDSLGARRGIDFNYLNPVIFYRPIEIQIGSPDNVLVGFSGHLELFKSTMLYGQIFIDEMIFSHIKSSTEYWDEKYGLQGGYKCYNTLGINRLYTQIEFNAVRPYTYSHLNPVRSYTHQNQALSHPLGANFAEAIAVTSYTYKDFFAEVKVSYAKFGANDTTNYGGNPLISYSLRPSDENILWLQGVKSSLKTVSFSTGIHKGDYILRFNMIYRQTQGIQNSKNIMLGIDLGIPLYKRYFDWL